MAGITLSVSQAALHEVDEDMKESEVIKLPLSMEDIRQWDPELESILRDIDSEHVDYLDYLRQVYQSRDSTFHYGAISIYAETNRMPRTICNICHEYQYIANREALARCPMANGCPFDFEVMKDHLQNQSHKAVLQYILTMQYKDRLLQHEFGGSMNIVSKLRELNKKMRDEIVDEKMANNDHVMMHDKHLSMLQQSKPPLYPFDKKSIITVKKRLGELLAFSIDQNEFVGEIIHQAVRAVRRVKSKQKDLPRPSRSHQFKLITDINAIPSVLSDLPFVNNVLQVISVTQPIIMKRLFQALIRESKMQHSHNKEEREKNIKEKDMQHMRELFESALKTTKMTIMDDIKQVDSMQSEDGAQRKDHQLLNLFSNGTNNINVKNWKYKSLDLGLLFDVYNIYRIDQYVLLGKFDTSPADLRQLCGEYEDLFEEIPCVKNDINRVEATVFQKAIRYYMTNIVQPIKLNKSWIVDGDVTKYMIYVFALSSYLKKLLDEHHAQKRYNIGALQFDLVLIVESHHIFSGKASHNKVIADLDLVKNLKRHQIPFVKRDIAWDNSDDRHYIQSEIENAINALLKRLKIEKDGGRNKTAFHNKRFVILIDKRRGEEHDENESDVLYVFERNPEEIALDHDAIMHYLSQKYLIPINTEEWIGAVDSQNGQLFSYSFHIHTLHNHRCYLYYNGGCTRTFPEHFVNLIPKYFRYPVKDKQFKKDFKKEFIKLLYSHDYKHGFDLVLQDDRFGKWYRIITGLWHITVNYRRIKVVSQSLRGLGVLPSVGNVFAAQKTLKDLNCEEFCFVLAWFLKEQKVEVDKMKLKQKVIEELKLDGATFAKQGRKAFVKGLKKIGIAAGKASKLHKQITQDLNEEKIGTILADFKPVVLAKNKVDADVAAVKEQKDKPQVKEQQEEEKQQKEDKAKGVKSMSELNLDEMYHVILYQMDKLKMECNLEDLANLLKTEMKLDGAAFTAVGRKNFGNKLKTIGIKPGKSGKLFKELGKMSAEELGEILSSMQKSEDVSLEKEDTISKPVDALTVEEVLFIFAQIVANDKKLNNAKFDMDQLTEIVTKNALHGAKCKEMKRKDFSKMVKPCGIKGGPSSQLYLKLVKLQPDEVGAHLKLLAGEKEAAIKEKEEEQEKQLEAKEQEDKQKAEGDIAEHTLESLNVEQFKTLFLSILKEKNIETDDEKLQKCATIITEQNIDGNMCKMTKSLKFAKLFKPAGIKSGPFSKAHKAIINLDVAEIGRKLLVSPPCNGNLEECANVKELCRVLKLFHNKSQEELLAINLNITETVKIVNNYKHLTTRHSLFGDVIHDLPEVRDENAADPEDLSNAEQYRQFQHKVFDLMTSRLGPCNSEGRNCYFIMRHSRDIELPENAKQVMNENNPMVLDTIASMHTFIFHNVEDQLYRLYDREAARKGESDYGADHTAIDGEDMKDNSDTKATKDAKGDKRQRRERDLRNNGLQMHFNKEAPNAKSSPLEDESDEERQEGVTETEGGGPGSSTQSRRPRRNCERFSTPVEGKETGKEQRKAKQKAKAKGKLDQNKNKSKSKQNLEAFSALKSKSSLGLLAHHDALTSSIKLSLPAAGLHPELNKFATSMVKVGDKKNEIYAINFGEKLDDWFSPLETAIFTNVHEEVTQNAYEKIFEETYDEIRKKCEILLKSQSNDVMLFSLDELIAIKLYTDCDKLQNRFRRTFWAGTPKDQRRSFFHWALMLQKTVTYGAVPIMYDVFHGLSNLFTVKKMLPIFHGPISTTTSANVATKFADTKGMLWRIQPRIWSELENPLGIKVHWMSRFEYEKEVLLMNCPLPIRKTKAFETGIHKKIEYLLDYLAKYNEPITDKKKFYTQVGLDKLVSDKFMGSELERLWLCDLGKSQNLWKISKRQVSDRKKLRQWLNEAAALEGAYWSDYVDKKVHAAKHNFFKKMQKIEDQVAEDQKVFCYGYVIQKLFENQKRGYLIESKKLREKLRITHDPKLQTDYAAQLSHYKMQMDHNMLGKTGAIKILSLLRGIPIDKIAETDPAIQYFRGKKQADIYNFLTKYIDEAQMDRLRLNYSVYYRLVNELDMFYLPFAAFTRVVYNGPFVSKEDRIRVGDDSDQKEALYKERHGKQSNLFVRGRYATIKHLDEGIPLLQEMVSKHCIRYRLQFRFRPDKQLNIAETIVNEEGLRHAFQQVAMDGKHLNRVKHDEFALISLSVSLSKSANCIPSEIMKVFDEIVNGSIEDAEYGDAALEEMSWPELYQIFIEKMRQNAKERKFRKERRKSEKYAWQFVDLDVDKIKREMIYLNIAGCSNFQVLNEENVWNYKLMCCVVDEDPDKWICVDKGRYRIDLDCVVPSGATVTIDSYDAMPRNRNRVTGFHRNVWVFRSLHLKAHSKLEIQPFGYNFINQNPNDEANGDQPGDDFDFFDDELDETDNADFMFGSIRLFCYESITIEEGATISVNGKGMYGSKVTDAINIGSGGHVKWINAKNKHYHKGKGMEDLMKIGIDIYSGGGYGSSGKPVRDESANGSPHVVIRGREVVEAKEKENEKGGRVILRGGEVYGEKELDTLYYGSSGGRGCIEKINRASYYAVSDRGGGIIELIAQRIVNHGCISANGKCGKPGGQWSSAGSGGSIKIKCKQFKNTGLIQAIGGTLPKTANRNTIDQDGNTVINETYQPLHGGGGDGRIAIYFDENLSTNRKEDDLNDSFNVNPKPYLDSTDKCNKSKLPQWQRPIF